jgi:hypothetical protein
MEWWQAGEGGWHTGWHRHNTHVADKTTPQLMGSVECKKFLATPGRGQGRGDGRQLEMP